MTRPRGGAGEDAAVRLLDLFCGAGGAAVDRRIRALFA